MSEAETPKIYVVCSDEGRNGKTLFARCYVDYLSLIGHEVHVIDLESPQGHISHFYPVNSDLIDLASTTGQIAVFDRMLSQPDRDYLIDLPSLHLDKFFSIIDRIDFVEEAHNTGFEFVVFYVVDRTIASLTKALSIRQTCKADRFVTVRNQMIGSIFSDDEAADLYRDIEPDGEIVVPELERDSIPIVEEHDFSFAAFHDGEQAGIPAYVDEDLRQFWPVLLRQLQDLQFKIDMVDLKKMGFV